MNKRIPKALVLAAGEGTRLRPLTLDRPKPMVPINGKPLLEHTLMWLREHGLKDIAINLHYRPQAILDHFGDGSAFGVRIAYSHEDKILGTAGAVRKLNGFVGAGPLVVMYGDVLTDLDLGALLAFHDEALRRDPLARVTMSLYHVSNPTQVGLVGLDQDGRVTRFVEKPCPEHVFTDLANAGVLVIEPDVIDCIPPDTFYDFGQHLFPQLLQSGVSMYGWVIPQGTFLLDIGTPEKYAQAQREWNQKR
jgi:mannose-1-phosphate guanylyltransferase